MRLAPASLGWLYGRKLYRLKDVPRPDPPSGQSSEREYSEAIAFAPQPRVRAWLVLPKDSESDVQQQQLLDKIADAMGLTAPEQFRLYTDSTALAQALAPATVPILVFGELPLDSATGVPVYGLPSLARMLTDVGAKRAAWEQIKSFKDRL